MVRCPWPPCGKELGPLEGNASIVLDHPEHRIWAEDAKNEYVAVDHVDGSRDVYRRPRRP